jgi:hypothetical protein
VKWLLTVPAGVDLGELRQALAGHGVTVDVDAPIPLADGEHVVEAEGPPELPALLEHAGLRTVKASPSSDLELYDAVEEDEMGPGR